MILLNLFWSFVQVGMFSVGGGYAAIPLIRAQVVTGQGWLTEEMFAHLVTIAEMTPGPIAINAATFVGMRLQGLPGAVVATLGSILPSCILVSMLAVLYRRYGNIPLLQRVLGSLRPGVVGLIASAAVGMVWQVAFAGQAPGWATLHGLGFGLFVGAFYLLRKRRWNPILVMALCGGINLLLGLVLD